MFRVEKYHSTMAPPEEDIKRPPGLYKCPECRDTTIIWRTAVDKYKVKCTKCNADMVRIKLIPKPAPLVPTSGIKSDYVLGSAIKAAPKMAAKLKSIRVKRLRGLKPGTAKEWPGLKPGWNFTPAGNEMAKRASSASMGFSHPTSQRNKLDELAEQYGLRAWWTKMRAEGKYTSGLEGQIAEAKKQRKTAIREAAATGKAPKVTKLTAQINLLEKTLGTFGKGPTAAAQRVEKAQAQEKWASLLLGNSSQNELDELAEIYASDPQRARLAAARAGVPLCQVAFHYGKGTALTGLQLGMKHGKEESAGTRGAPGALKLWLLQKLHGGSYVIGRQKGLGGKHGGTRSAASIVDALPALLKEVVGGQAQA